MSKELDSVDGEFDLSIKDRIIREALSTEDFPNVFSAECLAAVKAWLDKGDYANIKSLTDALNVE